MCWCSASGGGGPPASSGPDTSAGTCWRALRERSSRFRSEPRGSVTELETAARLAVAGLAGMAVGVEREWSGHASGPNARFAGVRTFLLLGGIGGVAGWLLDPSPAVAAALLISAGALIVAAYVTAARRIPEAIDGTTETAAALALGPGD